MRPRMHRKQYENAAKVIQSAMTGHWLQSSDAIRLRFDSAVANEIRHELVKAFSRFFAADNPAFSEERFAAACVPGADVKKRVRE